MPGCRHDAGSVQFRLAQIMGNLGRYQRQSEVGRHPDYVTAAPLGLHGTSLKAQGVCVATHDL